MRLRNWSQNLPPRFEIAKYWAGQERRFVLDIGEPACFACFYWDPKWDQNEIIERRWNESGLERAHVIAAVDGGSPTVDNVLLLCRRCHVDAPMTTLRTLMLQWTLNREKWLQWSMRKIQNQLRQAVGDRLLEGELSL
jgi:hypothetical protein